MGNSCCGQLIVAIAGDSNKQSNDKNIDKQENEFDPIVDTRKDSPAPDTSGNSASISCEKWEVGAIIGHHGKTIKEFERLSGASIHVERGDSATVQISGSVSAVAKARRLVESKLAESKEGPDYEGTEGKALRAEARKHGDEMHRLFDEAHAAHERGDGKAAKELSTRAHAEQASLHAANRKAVEAIFKHRNPKGADELRCDLHGLHKDEALDQLEKYFSLIDAKPRTGQRVCVVIPGAGHHSQDHHAVLKPAVEQWLRKTGYSFEVHDAGSFDVKV